MGSAQVKYRTACPPLCADSYIRKNAIKYKVPYITTHAGAMAAPKGIAARRAAASSGVLSLQRCHAGIG